MAQDFFSNHALDEEIKFIPMFSHQEKYGIIDEIRDGRIVAVRFTKPKVFYDIVDEYLGVIFENVDSAKVDKLKGVEGQDVPTQKNDVFGPSTNIIEPK